MRLDAIRHVAAGQVVKHSLLLVPNRYIHLVNHKVHVGMQVGEPGIDVSAAANSLNDCVAIALCLLERPSRCTRVTAAIAIGKAMTLMLRVLPSDLVVVGDDNGRRHGRSKTSGARRSECAFDHVELLVDSQNGIDDVVVVANCRSAMTCCCFLLWIFGRKWCCH